MNVEHRFITPVPTNKIIVTLDVGEAALLRDWITLKVGAEHVFVQDLRKLLDDALKSPIRN